MCWGVRVEALRERLISWLLFHPVTCDQSSTLPLVRSLVKIAAD